MQRCEKCGHYNITELERRILAEIAKGKTNSQICLSLNLSYKTLEYRMRKMFKRMEVKNRVQAVVIYERKIRNEH